MNKKMKKTAALALAVGMAVTGSMASYASGDVYKRQQLSKWRPGRGHCWHEPGDKQNFKLHFQSCDCSLSLIHI